MRLEFLQYKVLYYGKILVMAYSGWLVLIGFVSFPLFILEESCQVAMFATWAAKSAKDWDELEKGVSKLELTNQTLGWVNLWFGWINPFGWMAYHAYTVNTEVYISASRKLVARKRK